MEENKKSNGTVVIVILSILLILVSGYIVYDKVYLNKKESQNINNEKTNTLAATEQEVKKIYY